jgi:predicted kinase
MTVHLIATRGLPASGKTTWARTWVNVDPQRRARINRDDTRRMLHGSYRGVGWQERQTSIVCHGAILDLLRAGVSVVTDDTLLRDDHLTTLWEISEQASAHMVVADFTRVPPDVCVARDTARLGDARVGGDTVLRMFAEHIKGRRRPLRLPDPLRQDVEVVDMARPGVSFGGAAVPTLTGVA